MRCYRVDVSHENMHQIGDYKYKMFGIANQKVTEGTGGGAGIFFMLFRFIFLPLT